MLAVRLQSIDGWLVLSSWFIKPIYMSYLIARELFLEPKSTATPLNYLEIRRSCLRTRYALAKGLFHICIYDETKSRIGD